MSSRPKQLALRDAKRRDPNMNVISSLSRAADLIRVKDVLIPNEAPPNLVRGRPPFRFAFCESTVEMKPFLSRNSSFPAAPAGWLPGCDVLTPWLSPFHFQTMHERSECARWACGRWPVRWVFDREGVISIAVAHKATNNSFCSPKATSTLSVPSPCFY